MKWKELTKYLSLFVFAVAVIAVYKTFDNFGRILDFFHEVITLMFCLCPAGLLKICWQSAPRRFWLNIAERLLFLLYI